LDRGIDGIPLGKTSDGGIATVDIGKISPGKQADLALFCLDELRFSGSGDPLAALLLCGAHRADHVMVAGKWLVSGGQIISLDIKELQHEHTLSARRLCS